ncbi:MAG TPA: hypothetical protein PKC49_08785 [Phycisphaerae bacterium]|nr:hypothetical protein [Phycisphaerae bacterium]
MQSAPLEPLEVRLSDGRLFTTGHPELMTVTRTLAVISTARGADGVPRKVVFCDPVHIVSIEKGGNGADGDS